MNVDNTNKHFPFLLGRLPRVATKLLRAAWRSKVELLLAIPFLGVFLAVVSINDPHMFRIVDFLAIVILPMLYMVLLLMIRQSRPPR